MAHLDRGRGDGGESERHGHAQRKLQEQHCAESPSSRARSHSESLHRGHRTGKLRSPRNRYGMALAHIRLARI
jgi:hypothetical protein